MRNESLYRQWHILHLIFNHGNRGISQADLASEFNVSKRTIVRDIITLSTSGFPIYEEQDSSRGNQMFYYMDSEYKIPQISFSENEMISLHLVLNLTHSFDNYFSNLFKEAFSKITVQITPEYRNFINKLTDLVLPETTNIVPYNYENSKNISALVESILNLKQVSFDYQAMQSKAPKRHTISPLAIKFFNNNLYLAGYLKRKRAVLVFAINRIKGLQSLNANQDYIDFDAEAFFNNSFGIIQGEPFTAILKFKSEIAPYISERTWHPKQKLTNLENGYLQLELPAKSLSEMSKFVLSFKDKVEVIAPQELKEEVIRIVNNIVKIYNK